MRWKTRVARLLSSAPAYLSGCHIAWRRRTAWRRSIGVASDAARRSILETSNSASSTAKLEGQLRRLTEAPPGPEPPKPPGVLSFPPTLGCSGMGCGIPPPQPPPGGNCLVREAPPPGGAPPPCGSPGDGAPPPTLPPRWSAPKEKPPCRARRGGSVPGGEARCSHSLVLPLPALA